MSTFEYFRRIVPTRRSIQLGLASGVLCLGGGAATVHGFAVNQKIIELTAPAANERLAQQVKYFGVTPGTAASAAPEAAKTMPDTAVHGTSAANSPAVESLRTEHAWLVYGGLGAILGSLIVGGVSVGFRDDERQAA